MSLVQIINAPGKAAQRPIHQPVQHGLGQDNPDGELRTLWIETWPACNLACSYCFAESGVNGKACGSKMGWKEYESIIREAKEMGVVSIGIPGAGEPFHKENKDLTYKVLELCKELDIYATLFTTGELITPEDADRLYALPVELMVKGNSLNPAKQDAFVSNPKEGVERKGYGARRNKALQMLMEKGFNDPARYGLEKHKGRTSRLALVTSIMTAGGGGLSNYDEITAIQAYCRDNNIIFDCDTVLKRGRGSDCGLCLEDLKLKEKLIELRDKDRARGIHYEIGQGYVGTVCDRYRSHMYIKVNGDIHPCIGATGVDLGNVLAGTTLSDAWNRAEMDIIKARSYGGACGTKCRNFQEGKCNSCLGRRTTDPKTGENHLTNKYLLENGEVPTYGCWNHQPIE